MTTKHGLLLVISGPSGCGKGTLVKRLLEEVPNTVLSVSATTRAPRPGEVDGVHYHFVEQAEFCRMIDENEFLEHAQFSGNRYGTPKAPVEMLLAEGKNVILEIEVQGAEQVMDSGEDLVSIFLMVPSMEELERRLRGRGTENDETVRMRLSKAAGELSRAVRYQYVVMNDEMDNAVARVKTIIEAETMRYDCMKDIVMEVMKDAETYRY